MPKGSQHAAQIDAKINKQIMKWHAKSIKSMKNHSFVAEVFWNGPGPPNGALPGYNWDPFGNHFRQLNEKMRSKLASKNQGRKSIEHLW